MTTERWINLDPLERANGRLGRFVARYTEAGDDHPDADLFHAAVVKGYEFTYVLAYDIIVRYLGEHVLYRGDVAMMSNRDIIRVAAGHGLVTSADEWFVFRELRNYTAHEYGIAAVGQIVDAAPELHRAVTELLAELHKRLQ